MRKCRYSRPCGNRIARALLLVLVRVGWVVLAGSRSLGCVVRESANRTACCDGDLGSFADCSLESIPDVQRMRTCLTNDHMRNTCRGGRGWRAHANNKTTQKALIVEWDGSCVVDQVSKSSQWVNA